MDFEKKREKNQLASKSSSHPEIRKALNLGLNLADKVLREVQVKFTESEE